MKSLALLLLAISCIGCDRYKDGPMTFRYGDRVTVTSGFYEGQSGVVVNRTYNNEGWGVQSDVGHFWATTEELSLEIDRHLMVSQ